MKSFYYDTVLDEENICNLLQERKSIEQAIKKRGKLVVYGPRNFGKTSLIKNVVIPWFKAEHKESFVFFVDLMEVKSIDSIGKRISKGFEISFRESFPAKYFMEAVGRFLSGLRPTVSIEPLSGAPSLSIQTHPEDKQLSLEEIFGTILKVAKDRHTLIVLDEFQDIAFVDEAQGIFRKVFQEIKDIPLIVMGSKRHILSNIVAKPNAPLAMFGEDLEFKPIPYEEYHAYILERFKPRRLKIALDDARYLQDLLLRVPEAVNIVCADILDNYEGREIKKEDIDNSLHAVVEKRQSRYEEYLSNFSENEESVLAALAKAGIVKHPNSRDFLKAVRPTSRMVGIIVKQFFDRSVIDKKEEGYYISDPLLAFYLRIYR